MGSALGAARTLGVNQTTVVRRIAHMEEMLGGVLFERTQSGLLLTPFGQRVATAAARVESEILALESALHTEQRVLSCGNQQPRLDHMVTGRLSSVDVENFPGHETRRVQVHDRVHDIRLFSHSAHWM